MQSDKSVAVVKISPIPKLTGIENWFEWNLRFRSALEAQDADSALTDSKSRHSKLVKAYIVNSVDSSLLGFIIGAKTAKEAYNILQQYFGQLAEGNLQTLLLEYKHFEMQPGESITGMQARFTQLNASLTLAGNGKHEKDQCITFLEALPPQYETYKKMLMMTNVQSLSDIVMACMRAESVIKQEAAAAATEDPASTAKDKVYYTPSSGKPQFNGICNYCKKPGHIKRECHKLAEKKAREQEEEENEKKQPGKSSYSRVW